MAGTLVRAAPVDWPDRRRGNGIHLRHDTLEKLLTEGRIAVTPHLADRIEQFMRTSDHIGPVVWPVIWNAVQSGIGNRQIDDLGRSSARLPAPFARASESAKLAESGGGAARKSGHSVETEMLGLTGREELSPIESWLFRGDHAGGALWQFTRRRERNEVVIEVVGP